MINTIIPILIILGSCGTTIFLTKRKFEEILPMTLMALTLLTFIFGLFGNLLLGYYFTVIYALICVIFIITNLIKRKINKEKIYENFFTPGLLLFLLLYILLVFINNNRCFHSWDEFAHWGPMVKEMLRLNKFYCVDESVLVAHKDYPPIISLFETMWCKFSGGYSEERVYIGLQILSFSLFFPAFSKMKWRKNKNCFLKIIFIIALIMSSVLLIKLGDISFYSSVLIDSILGMLAAYSVFLVIAEKEYNNFSFIRLTIALSFLLLTKQIAIAFYALTLGIFIVNCIILKKNKKISNINKKNIIFVLFMIFIPLLLLKLWSYYIAKYNVGGQFNLSNISIKEFLNIINGVSNQAYKLETYKNFRSAFLHQTYIHMPVNITYWQLQIITIVLFYLIYKFDKKYFKKNQIKSLCILSILGSICYAFAMLLMYIFCFGAYEGPRLASLTRYMGTYWFMIFILLTMMFIFIDAQRDTETLKTNLVTISIILVSFWILILNHEDLSQFNPNKYQKAEELYSEDIEIITQYTDKNDKIYTITQGDNGRVNVVIKYLLMPNIFNDGFSAFGNPYYDGDVFTYNFSLKKVANIFSEYNYVYLYHVDNNFISKYSSLFKSDKIKDKQIYKVKHNNKKVELILADEQ